MAKKIKLTVSKGPQGEQGVQGPIGLQGKSAYTVWLEQGNTGSVQDYLDSLVGRQGETGLQGIQGEQGIQGIQGETGATGATGPQGEPGDITNSSIFDLSDTEQAGGSVAANSTLVYIDGKWKNQAPASPPPVYDELSDLLDTEISSPSEGQALLYFSADGKWKPANLTSSLAGLTDTSITAPAAGEALVYNNDTSVWENAEALVNLGTNVSAWIYGGKSYYMGAAGSTESNPLGIYFKPDGTRMFISGRNDDRIKEFALSTAWDITTSSFVQEGPSLTSLDGNICGLFFKSDGTKVYLLGYGNDRIGQYTLSTAWDISTMGSLQYYDTTNDGYATPYGLDLKPDGTEIYLATWNVKKVAQYTMSTAFDISTISFTREFDVSNETSQNVNSVRFAGNGTRMIIMDEAEKFFEYALSTAWDISTATFTTESAASPPNNNIDDFYIYEGGDKAFVIADGSDTVYEYSTKSYVSSRGLAVAGISAGQGTLSGGSIAGGSLDVGSGTITSGNIISSGSVTATTNIDNNGRFRAAKNNSQAELATWINIGGTSNKYIKLGGNSSATSDKRESDSYRHPATPGEHIIELGARGASITHIENLTELQEVTVNDNIIVYGNPKVEDTNPTATGTTIYSDTLTEASDTALGSHTSDSGHTYSTIFDDTGGNGPNLTVFGGTGQAGMDQSIDNEGQTFVSSAVTSGVDYELVWNYQVDLTGINGNDAINFPFGVVDSNNYFLLSLCWNAAGTPHGNSTLFKVTNGAGSEYITDPISYHSLTIASNTAYDVKIKLVDRQHYIYHDNTLIWSGYLSGFPYDTDHGAGIGIGDRLYSGNRESHINYKFNSVTQKEYQASDFTYPNSYIENGNLGIGTTTPSQPLHVDGNAKINGILDLRNSLDTDAGVIQVTDTSSANVSVGIGNMTSVGTRHIGIGEINNTSRVDYVGIGPRGVGGGNQSVVIGDEVAGNNGANGIVAIGQNAARFSSGAYSVAIGNRTMYGLGGQGGAYSVAVGRNALDQAGQYSVAVGTDALKNTSGANNTALGHEAALGASGTSTFANTVAIGYQALTALTTGTQNTAVGYQAGNAIQAGNSNTFVGYQAANGVPQNAKRSVAVGAFALDTSPGFLDDSTAVGYQAGYNSGRQNAFVGYQSGSSNGAHGYSAALGWRALQGDNQGTQYSVGIGHSAGKNSNGDYNVLIGAYTGDTYNSSFSNTVAVGYQALTELTTGSGNTAVGYLANSTSTDANYNTSLGYEANAGGVSNDNSVAVGYQAVAGQNRAVSIGALANAATYDTLAIGYDSGPRAGGNPADSVFIGNNAGNSAGGNGLGQRVVIGSGACSTNGGGRYSVYIGSAAGRYGSQNNNQSNVMIGANAAYNHFSTTNSVGIGHNSMNGADTTGSIAIGWSSNAGDADYNTMIGYQAGNNSLLGGSNTMIGHQSGLALTTVNGANNVALGYQAGTALTEGGNNVLIGYQAGSTLTTESNKLYIENSNSTTPLIYGEFDNNKVKIHNSLEIGVRGDDTGNAGTLTINGDAQAGHDPKFIMDGGWHGSADKFEIEIGDYSLYGPSLKAHQMRFATSSGTNRITFAGTPSLGINYNGNVFDLSGGILGTGVKLRTAENLETFQHTGFVYDWLEWTGGSSTNQGYDFHTYSHKNVLKLDGSNGQVSVKKKDFLIGTEIQNTANGFNSVFEFGAGSQSNYHSHLIFRPTGNTGGYNNNYWGSIGWDPSGTLNGLQLNSGNYSNNIWFTKGVPGSSNPLAYGRFDGSGRLKLHNTWLSQQTAPTEVLDVVGNIKASGVIKVNGVEVGDTSATGYSLPTATGTLGQVLEVDANGDLAFATPSGGGGGGLGSADQTLTADRTIDTNGYNLDIELDPTGTADTFTIHDGTHDLFQVDTTTSGTLFSVNDVSGLPTFQSNDDGSAVLPKILTAAPTGTATEGTMQLAIVSGTCYLYVYINGGWKRTTLT